MYTGLNNTIVIYALDYMHNTIVIYVLGFMILSFGLVIITWPYKDTLISLCHVNNIKDFAVLIFVITTSCFLLQYT